MKTIRIVVLLTAGLVIAACSGNKSNSVIEATGTIESTNVTVSSKNAGLVESLLIEEGMPVSEGDTLLIIEHESLRHQLEQSLAAEQIAEAQLSLMIKGARSEDKKQAEENMRQSEVNFKLTKSDFDRYTRLWETKSITQKQYEEISARYQIASAQFAAAKENYEKIKNLFRPEEIEQAKANLRKAQASSALLRKNIEDAYVVAPLSGVVVKKFIEKGETVSPMTSLVKISNLTSVNLIIYVSEAELGKVKLGQKVIVNVDTYPDKDYEGRVIYISPEAEFTPKNIQTKDERTKLVFAVKIEIKNDDYDLKPGMPADARIILQ